jgi:hypothetical protein
MNKFEHLFLSRPFIGCYRLQEESILQTGEGLSAVYEFEESSLRVSFSGNKTIIQEYSKEVMLKETTHADFQTAFFHHFSGFESLRQETFLRWKQKLQLLPNVFVEPFTVSRKGYLFFPGIFLFSVSVPGTKNNHEKLCKFIWYNGLRSRVHRRYMTNVYNKCKNGDWTMESINMVEFSLAWHEVYGLCEVLHAVRMIDSACPLPVIIQEHNSAVTANDNFRMRKNQID